MQFSRGRKKDSFWFLTIYRVDNKLAKKSIKIPNDEKSQIRGIFICVWFRNPYFRGVFFCTELEKKKIAQNIWRKVSNEIFLNAFPNLLISFYVDFKSQKQLT